MKAPPFASRLLERINDLTVYAGSEAWRAAKRLEEDIHHGTCPSCGTPVLAAPKQRGKFVVLPPDGEPAAYQWPVGGREVFVIVAGELTESVACSLGAVMLDQGATRVRVLWPTGKLDSHG